MTDKMEAFDDPTQICQDCIEYTLDVLDNLPGSHGCSFRGGSTVICNPPPTDTDIDICVLVTNLAAMSVFTDDPRWERPVTPYEGEDADFATFRQGKYNVMVFTNSVEFFAVEWATEFAKKLNIQSKEDRYWLFENIRSLARGEGVKEYE